MEEQEKEYWRWDEGNWKDPEKDWKDAEIITAGVDVGSVSSQAAILTDGELFAWANMRSGYNSRESAKNVMNMALEPVPDLKLENIHYTIGTGYGRVRVPFANRGITEIACHARGANYMYGPTVRTIMDMGGQDLKAISCDERGKVMNFVMKEKCAAGTGRGVEVMAELLKVPIGRVGELSFEVDEEPPPVSTTCVIFAKTEALSLMKSGWPVSRVLAAYCSAMAHRIFSQLQTVDIKKEFVITGGCAKNIGIVRRLEKELGFEIFKETAIDTQLAGALGAALFGEALYKKSKK